MASSVAGLFTAALGLAALLPSVSAAPSSSRALSGDISASVSTPLQARAEDDSSAGTLRSPAVSYNNSIALQRADPHIVKHSDGWYYFTATVPAYDKVILRRAKTIQELQDAEEVTVWTRFEEGPGSGYVWAPELHRIGDKWYIYVALGIRDAWEIRASVLEGTGDNPLEAEWEYKGIIETNWDTFSLDMHYFEAAGQGYLTWAQEDPTWGDTNTGLFIAPMIDPFTVQLPAVAISYPDLPWERIGHHVNEGAYVIKRDGTLFLTYSASATDHNYCLGLLTAPEDADLMDPSVWTKSQEPLFVSNEETGEWGPGHNSFTISEDGLSDIMIYHGRDYKEINGEPLNDPNRRTRVQKLYWREDGTPDFGIPVPEGLTPVRLRVAADESLYIRNLGVGAQAAVAGGVPVAETQFRLVSPGLNGDAESVSLESTNLPGRYLRRTSEGTVVLTAEEGSDAAFAAEASFAAVDALAGEGGLSFLAAEGQYIKVGEGSVLVVGEVSEEDAGLATFFTE